MIALLWLRGLVTREPGPLAGVAAGTAAAVALLGSLGAFFTASEATMTARSIARVSVDWQVEVQPGASSSTVLDTVRGFPQTRAALPVAFASSSGLSASTQGAVQTTGSGAVVGLPDGYSRTFPGQLRPLVGAPEGVLVAQQTASNLHVAPGDAINVGRTGLPPVSTRVDGVVDLRQADSLFQKVGAPAGSQPTAPPDNVVLVPLSTWHLLFDPVLTARPDLVHEQVHVRLSHNLPTTPVDAYDTVTGEARNLEARLAGAGRVGDNLGAALGAARGDALYAQLLFFFLGLPGAAIAGLVTLDVARTGGERRRREQALLRARGTALAQLLRLGLAEAAAAGLAGVGAGLAAAFVVGRLAFGSSSFGADPRSTLLDLGLASVVGLGIAMLALAVPAWRDARSLTVATAARRVGRGRAAPAVVLVFAALFLAGAAVVYTLVQRSGYELVLAPEGVPAVSITYWALLGPLFLWLGAALLVWWLGRVLLVHGRGALGVLLAPLAGSLAGAVAGSLSRQHRLLARAVLLVALAGAFAVATSVFNSTYAQQSEVDARLTNGGDVTITEPPGAAVPPSFSARLAAIPGVAGVEPLQHRFAYVGSDLQDLYGVRPSTVVGAAKLQDAYFSGGGAAQVMARLGGQPDGILVSAETVKDFQLQPGDRLTLRLRDGRTGDLVPVSFRYVGVVKEFPTAPRDSFLVANAAYVAKATSNDAVGSFLVDTNGAPPAAVAARVRSAAGPTATVTDIGSTRRIVGSSLTALDLGGLTRLELGFALVLAAAGAGVVPALALAERRHRFAVLQALGARSGQLAAFIGAEAFLITAAGILAGALIGAALAEVLVAVLTGVFDPPPASLAVPWRQLLGITGVLLAAALGAAAWTLAASRRSTIDRLRTG